MIRRRGRKFLFIQFARKRGFPFGSEAITVFPSLWIPSPLSRSLSNETRLTDPKSGTKNTSSFQAYSKKRSYAWSSTFADFGSRRSITLLSISHDVLQSRVWLKYTSYSVFRITNLARASRSIQDCTKPGGSRGLTSIPDAML